jgi:hypothetical protein
MREGLQNQAAGLARDTDVTTANIRASAELRQAIANTTLPRVILCVGGFALAIAVISLFVALR